MRSSFKLFVAASVTVAALGIGCQSVPDTDAPGGILSGNEFSSQRSARGTTLDHSIVGTGGGSSMDASHSSAGPNAAGGTVTAGGGPTRQANSPVSGTARRGISWWRSRNTRWHSRYRRARGDASSSGRHRHRPRRWSRDSRWHNRRYDWRDGHQSPA